MTATAAQAQVYAVHFADKNASPYSVDQPEAFLSQRSIDRRARLNVPTTVEDLPVSPAYIAGIEAMSLQVTHTSRWLNCALVPCTASQAAQIEALPYVSSVELVKSNGYSGPSRFADKLESEKDFVAVDRDAPKDEVYGAAFDQINQINGIPVHEQGFDGEGVLIAVIDAGFANANNIGAFSQLYNSGRIVGELDVVQPGGDIYSYSTSDHGTNVLSCIGGYVAGQFRGTAPGASFALIRTEDAATEQLVECYYWTIGAEYADSLGADIINTSLGYNEFDYSYMTPTMAQMDGETLPSSIGAKVATEKGVFVTVSAGNSNGTSWPRVGTPADVVNAATIGAVDVNGSITSFSSLGPNGANDPKPNVCARGGSAAVISTSGSISTASGTSFSSPIACGMYACLIQANPGVMPADLKDVVDQTGNRYPQHHDAYGYGIPDFAEALDMVLNLGPVVFEAVTVSDNGSNGNNDGMLNPGESATLGISLRNVTSTALTGVTATLTSTDPEVQITQNTATFGNIGAEGVATLADAFAVTLSSQAQPSSELKFFMQVSTSQGNCLASFNMEVHGIAFSVAGYAVHNDANDDGVLDPGESATLSVHVANVGTQPATAVAATLATTSQAMTIHQGQATLGNIGNGHEVAGEFQISLAENASPSDTHPFTLTLAYNNGQTAQVDFVFSNTCVVVFDLYDDFSDGWNGSALQISFDNGTPSRNITLTAGGHEAYDIEVVSGSTMTVDFISGTFDKDCSFEISYQTNGMILYQSQGTPIAGQVYSGQMDCGMPCVGVFGLASSLVGEGSVKLTWGRPSNTVVRYQVDRDGIQIAEVAALTYTDNEAPQGEHRYCVRAIYDNGCVSDNVCLFVNVGDLLQVPASGIQEVTTCLGTVFDDGGASNDYSASCNGQLVIHPAHEGAMIRVQGTYSVEQSYDYLRIFDGVGDTGSMLGEYSGMDGVIAGVTSTQGPLTLKFTSDASVQRPGFVLEVSCHEPDLCHVPAQFAADLAGYDATLSWQPSANAVSYTVYRDGQELSAELTETQYLDADLAPDSSFCYQVQSICADGESQLTFEQCVTTPPLPVVGIDKEIVTALVVYPNPTTGDVTVVNEQAFQSYEVVDLSGRMVAAGELLEGDNRIHLSGLQSGVYHLVLNGPESIQSVAVVKQ